MSQTRRVFLESVAALGASGELSAEAQPSAAQLSPYELSNNKVTLLLDAQGRLIKLTNRQTGNDYVSSGNHAPWRMYYRSGPPMTGALDLAIDPDAQKAQIRREGNSLLLSYASLTAHVAREGQARELRVGLTLHIGLDSDDQQSGNRQGCRNDFIAKLKQHAKRDEFGWELKESEAARPNSDQRQ